MGDLSKIKPKRKTEIFNEQYRFIKTHLDDGEGYPICRAAPPLHYKTQLSKRISEVSCAKCFRIETGTWPKDAA